MESELWSARATSTSDRSLERLLAPAAACVDICSMKATDLVVFEREDEPVGILEAEIDAVRVGEFVVLDPLPIDETRRGGCPDPRRSNRHSR